MTETPDQAALRAFLKPYTAKSDLRGALSFTCTVAVYGVALVLGVWLVEAGRARLCLGPALCLAA